MATLKAIHTMRMAKAAAAFSLIFRTTHSIRRSGMLMIHTSRYSKTINIVLICYNILSFIRLTGLQEQKILLQAGLWQPVAQ